MDDEIKKPSHYHRYKIEPVTFIMDNQIPYAEGNVIKYICRWRFKYSETKDRIKDLEKAKQYIDLLIQKEKQETTDNDSKT